MLEGSGVRLQDTAPPRTSPAGRQRRLALFGISIVALVHGGIDRPVVVLEHPVGLFADDEGLLRVRTCSVS